MDQFRSALGTAAALFMTVLGVLLGGISFVIAWLRHTLAEAGMGQPMRDVVLWVALILLAMLGLRALGGLFKLVVIVFLVLMALELLGAVSTNGLLTP
jgi:hypothetical protein